MGPSSLYKSPPLDMILSGTVLRDKHRLSKQFGAFPAAYGLKSREEWYTKDLNVALELVCRGWGSTHEQTA